MIQHLNTLQSTSSNLLSDWLISLKTNQRKILVYENPWLLTPSFRDYEWVNLEIRILIYWRYSHLKLLCIVAVISQKQILHKFLEMSWELLKLIEVFSRGLSSP